MVTRRDARLVRSAVGTAALRREVAALRCGLDATLWEDVVSSKTCKEALGAEPRIEVVT